MSGVINGESTLALRDEGSEQGAFIRWVLREGSLSADDYKWEMLNRRLPACLRVLRATSVAGARLAVQRSGDNLRAAISALIIGVTSFYRDPAVFECLERKILPDHLATARPALRVWSVGCSDGPELYTIAMLLAERAQAGKLDLLGTDCRRDAIARASLGLYDYDAIKPLPRHLRMKYLRCEASGWRVQEPLRSWTRWQTADALEVVEPGWWDLIACRNVAIYLSASVAARLWHRLAGALRPGGVLMLGKAERPLGVRSLVAAAPCFYRKIEE